MKLVIVGGGGFRVPQIVEVLSQARTGTGSHPGLVVDEVCLHDVSTARLDTMRAVLRDLAFPSSPRVTATTELRTALRGADFVFSAFRVGGTCGRVLDERVALAQGVLGQETVGAGGYAFAFRTIPAAMELARAVREVAPGAWVINFTNPAGIITQAMRTVLGERVVGICDTPIGLVRRSSAALGLDPARISEVPGGPAGGEGGAGLDFDYVGLNHLGWLRSLTVDGSDRLPALIGDDSLLDHIEEARAIGVDWIRTLGMLPNEYLFYYYLNRESVARIREEAQTRGEFLDQQQGAFYREAAAAPERAGELWTATHDEREATYMAESRSEEERAGRREEDIAGGGYQQVALDLMTAISTGTPARMILDVANSDAGGAGPDGAGTGALLIPQLREDAVVEVPCLVDADGVHPRRVGALSGPELGLVTSVKACEELVIEAAFTGRRELAWRALASHPLVDSVNVAKRVLDGYIQKNPDVGAVFER
ncbi:6-phospho-beta-glucosidase [Schaalia naturae]|uniref:6-phospho-beta-glucosidase n=1 Tax=Schaalia naturae TaxID=635203 RepID=A0ABW2SNC1_9ACTO